MRSTLLLGSVLMLAAMPALADPSPAALAVGTLAETATAAVPPTVAHDLASGGRADLVVTLRDATSSTAPGDRRGDAIRAAVQAALARAGTLAPSAPTARATGLASVVSLATAPVFSARLSAAEAAALAADPAVLSIRPAIVLRAQLTKSLGLVEMPAVIKAGGTGKGWSVAVVDTGVRRTHEFLKGRIVTTAEGCFLQAGNATCPNGKTTQTGSGSAEWNTKGGTGAHHGTHVAGIAAGFNTARGSGEPTSGVARSARIVPINVFGGSDLTDDIALTRALEHVEDLVLTKDNVHRIAAVNMSIGGTDGYAGSCEGLAPDLAAVMDRLRRLGVPVVISAGNESQTARTTFPGCLGAGFAVGATGHTARIASYTNIGTMTDIMAPGGDSENGDTCILSAIPTGTSRYGRMCGTSMAAPHVAGAITVLRQLFPTTRIGRIQAALVRSGTAIDDDRIEGGLHRRLIRVDAARRFLKAPTPPANDGFAAAARLELGANSVRTNAFATLQAGEPVPYAGASRSVWYAFRSTVDRTIALDTAGSDVDTALAVYTGTKPSALTRVVRNDNRGAGTRTSRVTFKAKAGVSYAIQVTGRSSSEEGTVVLAVRRAAAYDDLLSAGVIIPSTVATRTVTASSVHATVEPREPLPLMTPGFTDQRTLWWRFRAPITGTWTIDTKGSDFDTVLAVYTGTSYANLERIGFNDQAGGSDNTSRYRLAAKAGTTYLVQVKGWQAPDAGTVRLRLTPPGVTPSLEIATTAAR